MNDDGLPAVAGAKRRGDNYTSMGFSPEVERRLGEILATPLVSTLRMRVETEPWDESVERELRPLHFALVPPAVWKGSKFERSFVTSLGNVWEKAAIEASRGARTWMRDRDTRTLGRSILTSFVLSRGSSATFKAVRRRPDWDAEVAEVFAAASGSKEACRVIVDVAIGDSEGDRTSHDYYEIKSPKPNSDQTKVSKEKMLKLTAMEERECAYYALPFNPYGTRSAYAWSPPGRWLDMTKDRIVLIGSEFWERLGGPGTWEDLLTIAHQEGEKYRDRIEAYLLDN